MRHICIKLAALAALLFMPVFASADLILAKDGKSAFTIVVPSDAGSTNAYAARELQRYLLESTGAKLPIVDEAHAKEGRAILVGVGRGATSKLLGQRVKKLGTDGVLIRTHAGNLVLAGMGDRGTLYSVYCFLERTVGVRFLARDCTVVPKRAELRVPPTDYAYSPPFIYREELYYDAAYFDFAARLKLNGSNMKQVLGRPMGAADEVATGVGILPFVHSAAGMVPPSRYFATHPEYFGLVGGKRIGEVISGQLCYTNPDVLRICTDESLKILKENSGVVSVDISQNDSWPGRSGACECEKCRAIVKEEGAEHGPILRFVNAIADVVAKQYPDKFVDTLAYSYSVATPKITKPLDNVIIRLCHFACYFHGIEGEELGGEYRSAVDDWVKVAKNVWVWHYGVNFWSYLAPNPNLAALAKDIRYYRRKGVNGLMLQGDIQSPGGELAEVRMYLAAQLMWDPSQDPMVLRHEFCRGYYQAAFPDVLAFLALMDQWGASSPHHIPMNGWNPPDVTPPDVVAEGLKILRRAYGSTDDAIIRNRIEKLLLPFWAMQLSWPEKYGLTKEQGKALLPRVRAMMTRNAMTTVSEGGPSPDAWLKGFEGRFGG